MTTSHARGIKQDVLNDSSVGDYLQTYPDFFERNSQLLTKLRLPHLRDAGATVSLVERQIEVLRERSQSLERVSDCSGIHQSGSLSRRSSIRFLSS